MIVIQQVATVSFNKLQYHTAFVEQSLLHDVSEPFVTCMLKNTDPHDNATKWFIDSTVTRSETFLISSVKDK